MTDWRGNPVPPSRLQVLVADNPFARAYGATFGPRIPKSLASSFEDYLAARLVRRAATEEDVYGFLRLCLYAKDAEVYGRHEVWIHPEDFERNRVGDCEDSALWAWVQFVRLGWEARFTAGLHEGGGHAWVTVYRAGRTLICETTCKKRQGFLVRADGRTEYEPVWSVDGEVRFFWHGPLPDEAPGIEFLE